MAATGRVRHWKHGWIPISPEAKAYVAGKGPRPGGDGPVRIHPPGTKAGTRVGTAFSAPGTPFSHTSVVHRVKPDPGRTSMYSPEAEAAATRVLAKASAMEPSVTPNLARLAAQNGGFMQGLAYRLKTQESLARKLDTKSKAKGISIQAYESKIGDALRYTQISNGNSSYQSSSQKTIDALRGQGFKVEVENTWTPGSMYKGVNTNVTDAHGNTFELQFHTTASFAVKMKQHDLYEISRDPKKTPAERAAANAQMEANMAALPDPPGAGSIH